MVCERCRNEIVDRGTICPVCGKVSSREKARVQPIHGYGLYAHQGSSEPPHYQQSNTTQTNRYNQAPLPPYNAQTPPYNGSCSTNYARSVYGFAITSKNNQALIIEIIFSLFGVFGIGWLVAGETVVGAILLTCSILLYWPIVILVTIFTFGIGLICLGPLAIAAIILNILLLNAVLNRKAESFIVMPPSQQPIPPLSH